MLLQLSLQPTLGSNSAKLTDDIGKLLGPEVSREAIREVLRVRNTLLIPLPMFALAVFAVQDAGYHVGEHPKIVTVLEGDPLEAVVPRFYRMSYVRASLLSGRGEVQWTCLVNLLLGFAQHDATANPKIPSRSEIAIFSRMAISLFRNVNPLLLEACGLKQVEEVANRSHEDQPSKDSEEGAASPEDTTPPAP